MILRRPKPTNVGQRTTQNFSTPTASKVRDLGLVTFQPQRQPLLDAWKSFYEPFIQKLRDAGATLVDVKFPDFGQGAGADRTAVLEYEFKADVAKYLAESRRAIQDACGPDQI